MTDIKKEVFHLKPYSPKEIRQLYNDISYKTFIKWISPFKEQLGEAVGGIYNVNQVRMIVEKWGIPERLEL